MTDPRGPVAAEAAPGSPAAEPQGAVTRLLREWSEGSGAAGDRLFDLVYPELKSLARQHLSRERSAFRLRPTELVHEVYLRLAVQRESDWQNRSHFFALAATFIRRILVDEAKRRPEAVW